MFFVDFACVSALGLGADITMAAVDAGISAYRETDYQCKNDSPAVMGLIDDALFEQVPLPSIEANIGTAITRSAKLLKLALEDLKRLKLDQPAPLIWCQADNGMQQGIPKPWLQTLIAESQAPIEFAQCQYVQMGRAGGVFALEKAQQLFANTGAEFVIIGAAECPLSLEWLAWLDQRERLKTAEAVDAFAPGEAAVFLVLAKTAAAAQRIKTRKSSAPPIQYSLPGIAQSPSHWFNSVAHKGEGLFEAVVSASQSLGNTSFAGQAVESIVSSINGEMYWMKEYRVAFARLQQQLDNSVLYHPFECTGDLSCASGVFLLAYAAHLIETGYHRNALITSSSDNGWRSAAFAYI